MLGKCGRCGKGRLKRKRTIGSRLVVLECDSCGGISVKELDAIKETKTKNLVAEPISPQQSRYSTVTPMIVSTDDV